MSGRAATRHDTACGFPVRAASRWLRLLSAALILSALSAGPAALAATAPNRGVERYEFTDADRLTSAGEFSPWADMMRRRAAEPVSLEACVLAEAACPPALRGARMVVLRGRTLSEHERLELVNRFVNRRRYVDGAVDRRWETPASFLRRGGDCEDYAVAKYFLLRALGLVADDLRVVVGRTRRSGGNHALLAVRTRAGEVVLLDTDDRIHAGERRSDYAYLYSVNEDGLWDHAGSRLGTTVGTAAVGQPAASRSHGEHPPAASSSALPIRATHVATNPATTVATDNED